jgi:hypothetical protein
MQHLPLSRGDFYNLAFVEILIFNPEQYTIPIIYLSYKKTGKTTISP